MMPLEQRLHDGRARRSKFQLHPETLGTPSDSDWNRTASEREENKVDVKKCKPRQEEREIQILAGLHEGPQHMNTRIPLAL